MNGAGFGVSPAGDRAPSRLASRCAGPAEFLRRGGQSRSDRVEFNVVLDPPETFVVANQAIIALVLPEWHAASVQNLVGSMARESLQWPQPLAGIHERRHQEMDVVGHDYVAVQAIPLETRFAVGQGLDHELGDLGLAQECGAAAGLVQESVQSYEGSAGGHSGGWEDTVGRQTARQAEGDEEGLSDEVPVGEAAFVLVHG